MSVVYMMVVYDDGQLELHQMFASSLEIPFKGHIPGYYSLSVETASL